MALGLSYPLNRAEGAGERVRWYQAALAAHPGNLAVLNNLGIALLDQGKPDRALATLDEAVRLDSNFAMAHYNRGLVLAARGKVDEAIAAYRDAARLDPEFADAHYNLGLILRHEKGNVDGAIAAHQEAIRIDPTHDRAHCSLGAILCDVKRDYDGAIAHFQAAIRIDPKCALYHRNLGNAWSDKGGPDRAIAAYRDAVQAAPRYADAHHSLAWLLAAGPDGVRDGKRAVEHATRACELTGWKNPVFIDTLAAAYAEAGDFDKAIEYQKKTLTFPEYEKRFGKPGQERLQLYSQKKPFRDPTLARRKVAAPPRKVKP
jgi:tetratricopeptide (TPR) repeat protein